MLVERVQFRDRREPLVRLVIARPRTGLGSRIEVPPHCGTLELEALELLPCARERCEVRVARGEKRVLPGAQREAAELGGWEERHEDTRERESVEVVRAERESGRGW